MSTAVNAGVLNWRTLRLDSNMHVLLLSCLIACVPGTTTAVDTGVLDEIIRVGLVLKFIFSTSKFRRQTTCN